MKKSRIQRARAPRPGSRSKIDRRWAVLLLAVVALTACSDSGPSGPGAEPDFRYEPDLGELQITILNSQFFKVETDPAMSVAADWYVDGEKQREGSGFNYFPGTIGWDTVRVEAVADGYRDSRQWLVRVLPSEDTLPPEVAGVSIEHAAEPGEAVVRWLRIVQSTHPMQDYRVRASYDGPVSMANWDQAILLDTVPHVDGTLQYSGTYDLEDGQPVWVAVRARDELEQLSDITRVYDHTVSYPWTLGVRVQEVGGDPVSEVILRWQVNGRSFQGNTPFNGFLEIGPFRNVDQLRLETQINNGEVLGDYYDFLHPEITVELGTELGIHLIPRHTIDEECTVGSWDGEFLRYMRYLTRTETAYALRPNHQLLHWAEYPLTVHIPEATRPGDDLDLRATALAALDSWNTVMGEDYFVETADFEAADVYFDFADLPDAYGEAILELPAGRESYQDSVIPERVRVSIDTGEVTDAQFVHTTIMHELGHVLGVYEHAPSDCSSAGYLMYSAPGTTPTDPNGGIHPDEQLLAKVIRYLPQGMEMNRYVLD